MTKVVIRWSYWSLQIWLVQHCHQDCVDLPDEAKEEVEEDGEGEEDNKDCNAEESHGGQGDANVGPYDDGGNADAEKLQPQKGFIFRFLGYIGLSGPSLQIWPHLEVAGV